MESQAPRHVVRRAQSFSQKIRERRSIVTTMELILNSALLLMGETLVECTTLYFKQQVPLRRIPTTGKQP